MRRVLMRLVGSAVCLALVVGCAPGESTHEATVDKSANEQQDGQVSSGVEPTWDEVVEAVNRGNSAEIRLTQSPITDSQLVDLAGLTELRRLNLPKSQISDQGLKSIAQEVPDLELLRLGSPNVSDEGLATIAQLKKLRFLHLIDVPITDAGLEHLEAMTWLESFYLDGGAATDEGLSELITALPELHFHRDQQHLPGDPHADDHGH